MPNKKTFDVLPISELLNGYVDPYKIVVDPFSGGSTWGSIRNDLNPKIPAHYHKNALEFLLMIEASGKRVDVVLFDPPYSPRQIKEVYEEIGLDVFQQDTQLPGRWSAEKDVVARILKDSGFFIQFGWNSTGLGKKRGFKIQRILLVNHGAGHNDTICIVESRI